jgi:hypothetical protein
MNVDEALRRLGAPDGFPREAMVWALAHWDEAAPRFLSRLRGWAARGAVPVEAADEAFFIVHLCGDRRETRAYEPLCRLIASDPAIHNWLGDGVTETLPGILITTFDGDAEPLVRAIESTSGEEYARASALSALGYVVRTSGALDAETMQAFLRTLHREMKFEDGFLFWIAWAETAANLGYESLRSDLVRLNEDDRLDRDEYNLGDFDAVLRRLREDPADLSGFADAQIGPFSDAIGTLEAWESDDAADEALDEEAVAERVDSFDGPYVNPLRDVGRNDPCPCGSGKKYKKCCLAA